MELKDFAIRMHWILSEQFGINFLASIRSFTELPRYFCDLKKFRSSYHGYIEFMPCLLDRREESGINRNEYFLQDLLVAQRVRKDNPKTHVDVGSRIDGFVAHVASFREIEVFDVRPMSITIPGVVFKQADLMMPNAQLQGYCDSLSCLHALEHFGLGRYGDPVDPQGLEKGFINMVDMVTPGGLFYLSLPIGTERVIFNANRVSDPRKILFLAEKNQLNVIDITVILDGEKRSIDPTDWKTISELANISYALGIFVFKKKCTE